MIDSVLIANRGEIACRIIRTCRRLGLRTVAVYSEVDAQALHVELADEKHCIGPAEAGRSYLRPDAIVQAALAHGASAIHPGYGFLSERIELAQACAEHGIVWIGPSPDSISVMGSKIESKAIAREANVEGVPGYDGEDQSQQSLIEEARAIGFPLLIKASAGGGGKGMRLVESEQAFPQTLETAKREAQASFGDERVLLEKYITRPRHLEVQLAGDHHGNVIHLFERECSIQRHYQKVIEEAPAARLLPEVRDKLLDAAVRLGKAIAYDSLGTVEFILEAGETQPYFLEMNTRLQVEHPVTEMVTGLDLVELQLRIAAGEPLPFHQDAVNVAGAAIEARLNAEDASADYRPNIGRIERYEEPAGEGVRVDSGVRAGSEVTPYYDSMLAKVIASGPDRASARRRLGSALERFVVLGVGTNQAFLRDIVRQPAFDEVLTTRFIAEVFPEGWQEQPPDEGLRLAAAVAAIVEVRRAAADLGPWTSLSGFRVLGAAGHPGRSRWRVRHTGADEPAVVDVVAQPDGFSGEIDGKRLPVRLVANAGGLALHREDGVQQLVSSIAGDKVGLFVRGNAWEFEVLPYAEARAELAKSGGAQESDVSAAMPGLINEVAVEVGQSVQAGEPVVYMEAMKLSYTLTAPVDGAVTAVHCEPGQTVAGGARLVEIEPADESA